MCNLILISQCVPGCKVLYDAEDDKTYCRDHHGNLIPSEPVNKPMADTVYAGDIASESAFRMVNAEIPAASCVLVRENGGIMCYRRNSHQVLN